MASFYDDLRPASFRGIAFEIQSDDTAFGRRVVTHQYPGRDEPFHEDMGQAVKEISFTAVIVGAAFSARADALENALLQSGAGTLIHPHYGEVQVVVKSARRQHSTDSVGQVLFSVTVEKYGEGIYPARAAGTAALLSTAGDKMFGSIASEFKSRFNLDLKPDYIAADALSRVEDFSASISSGFHQGGFGGLLDQFMPSAWDVASDVFGDSVVNSFRNLVGLIAPVRRAVVGPTLGASFDTASVPAIMIMMSDVAGNTSVAMADTGSLSGPSRADNAEVLDFLFRASILAAAGSSARYAVYENKDQARAVRDGLGEQLSVMRDQLGASGYDETWMAAGDMLAALTRDINERIGRLPATVRIQPVSTRTSLDLANRLYGDDPSQIFARADDLVKRNAIRHPGFIPAESLEVLV